MSEIKRLESLSASAHAPAGDSGTDEAQESGGPEGAGR